MRLNGEYRRREWVVVFRVRGLAFGIWVGSQLESQAPQNISNGL